MSRLLVDCHHLLFSFFGICSFKCDLYMVTHRFKDRRFSVKCLEIIHMCYMSHDEMPKFIHMFYMSHGEMPKFIHMCYMSHGSILKQNVLSVRL